MRKEGWPEAGSGSNGYLGRRAGAVVVVVMSQVSKSKGGNILIFIIFGKNRRMTFDSLLSNIGQYIKLNEEEKDFLLSALIPRPFQQGELIVRSGEPARYMLFVLAGSLMTYFTDSNGADHVIQFAGEGWWSGDIYSLSDQPVTRYSTKGLTKGEVFLLPRLAQQELLERYPKFERYFRITFQKGLMRQQLRYVEGHSTSAEERYQSFIQAYPAIAQTAPQKYIASYLGITPEFLSKVRKNLSQTGSSNGS